VLFGKQLFYNANVGPRDHDGENRINTDGYLTCASCHLEGHADQRVWDFTQAGEGLRNTVSLLGRRGTGHGRVHWTANFDEIQDFEHPIRDLFGGTGLMDDAEFDTGTRNTPLGDRKAGLSVELDALAAYVASLDRVNPSPRRNPDSTLTADALAGKALFQSLNCVSCHAGPDFTDSASDFLHDVGTIRPSSGGRLGAPLTGLDTPTLKGIWETAPYLHDGSAANLLDVLTTANPAGKHGSLSSLTPPELAQLVAYLEQIDEEEAASPPSLLFVARLSGGRGLGKVVLKDDGTTALISLRPSGLSGTQTEAHLHGPGGMKIALPLGSFIDHVLLLTPPQVAQLKRGDLSFDVHTDAHPAGEAEGPIVDPYASPAAPGSSDRGCGMTGLEGLLTLLPFFFRRRFFR
jgi:mono/diheme cytochrome c family protein